MRKQSIVIMPVEMVGNEGASKARIRTLYTPPPPLLLLRQSQLVQNHDPAPPST